MVEELFGTEPILSKTGPVNPVEACKDAKLIGIYFSMHNCPPCRAFTPVFAELYKETNESGKVIEVIFLSGDRTQEEYDEYYSEQPWLALPKGDPRLATLAKRFDVKGVPRLIVIKPDGTVVDNSAVKKVTEEGPSAIEEYLAK
jgi:nucleoredoxin